MNILVTSLPDLSKLNPQRPHHILNHLSKKHKITILCGNAWWLKNSNIQYLEDNCKNIEFNYFTQRKLNPILQEIFAVRILNQLEMDVDSYDIHINFNSLIAGYNISKKIDVPTIFDICDDLIDWISISPQIPTILKPIGKRIASLMINKNINDSDQITYSLEILKDIYGIPDNKANLIPNGVDTNHFKKTDGKIIREKLKIYKDKFVLAFVGYIGNWIDLEPVFRVINQLKNKYEIHLLVVGDGDNLIKFKNLSKKLGIQSYVTFVGNINYNHIPKYISAADVCLLPFNKSDVSQRALPLKLFEYMSCEKPVISSNLINIKNIVNGRVIFVKNDELEDKIVEVCENEELRVNLGKNGRIFVKNQYNWNFIGHTFEKILYQTIEEN